MKENRTASNNVLIMMGTLAAILVTIGTMETSLTQLASAQSVSIPTNTTQQASCDAVGSSSAIAGSCDNTSTNNIANSGGVIDFHHKKHHSPHAETGTITVTKHVINDDGGTLQASDFTIEIFNFVDPYPVASFPGSETGTTVTLPAGHTYGVVETFGAPAPGYSVSLAGDCRDPAGQGSVGFPLNPGDHRTCTITNDDNP
jgi:hypothetical protein